MSGITKSVLGWGSLDIEFLDGFIDEHNLDSDDVASLHSENYPDSNKENINEFIYCALELAYTNFRDKLKDYVNEKEINFNANEVNPNIHTNCIDSGYGSFVGDYNLTDFSDENFENFIKEAREV